MSHGRYILALQCPDAIGIVAAVATFLADRGLSIEESDQFHDSPNFYMRTAFSAPAGAASLSELEAGFAPIARRFAMAWRFHDSSARPKIMLAVSAIGHCLHDLSVGSTPISPALYPITTISKGSRAGARFRSTACRTTRPTPKRAC
jgi:formyltetrahydrofolate hydrolase